MESGKGSAWKLDRAIEHSTLGRLYWAIIRALAPTPEPNGRLHPADRALAVALGLFAVLVASRVMALMPTALYDSSGYDIWFQADQPRALGALTDRLSTLHGRDNVHPLYSILLFPVSDVLRRIGFSPLAAGQAVILFCGYGSVALLYLVLRRMELGRLSATMASVAFIASATFLHWFGLVETYPASSLTAIAAIYLFVAKPRASSSRTVLAQMLSLSMVVTNWSLGLALSATRWPLARFARYTLASLLLCVVLSATQHRIFPYAGEFYHRYAVQAEEQFVGHSELKAPHKVQPAWLDCVQGIAINAAVAPTPYFDTIAKTDKKIINNQESGWHSYGTWGNVAVASWLVLLTLSAVTIFIDSRPTPTLLAISAFLAGQLLLHILYGDITFLYAADFFVVMMVFAAQGAKGRWRGLHGAALACFIVSGAMANTHTLRHTTEMARQAAEWAAQSQRNHPATPAIKAK